MTYDQKIQDLLKTLNTQNDSITGLNTSINTMITPSIKSINDQVTTQNNSIKTINTNLGSNIQPSIQTITLFLTNNGTP